MTPFEADDELDLRHYLEVLRRRWKPLVAAIVLVTVTALGWAGWTSANAEPEFAATHRLAANEPRAPLADQTLEQLAIRINDGDVAVRTEDARADHPDTSVEATADLEAAAVEIRAQGPDPDAAVELADAVGEATLEAMAAEHQDELDQEVVRQQQAVDDAADELARAEEELEVDPDDPAALALRDNALNTLRGALDSLQQAEDEPLPEPQFRSLTTATAETVPLGGLAGRPLAAQLALTLTVAAMLGVGLAFLVESLDQRMPDPDAIAAAFGTELLTEVPDGGRDFERFRELAPPASPISESYRRLRSILQMVRDGRPTDTGLAVMVTSAQSGEGKTVTVAHLGRALAETGERTLVVSADFRRPELHSYFGLAATSGLSALAESSGAVTAEEIVHDTDIAGLSVVTAGAGTDDPIALIRVSRQMVRAAVNHYDYVLLDSSPLLMTNDAVDLAPLVDVVIMTSRLGGTNRRGARRSAEMIRRTATELLGVVVTRTRPGDGYDYYAPHPPAHRERGAPSGNGHEQPKRHAGRR